VSRAAGLAARLVTGWARLYTAGLPSEVRDRRRGEIASDVHTQVTEARRRGQPPTTTACSMVARLVLGGWHDLAWRRGVARDGRGASWRPPRGTWIACALIATTVCATVWFGWGLSLRNGADREPERLALAAQARLATGTGPPAVLPAPVDVASSSSPFVMVFDRNGRLLASSGQLDGQAPQLPAGVLDWVRRHGEDRITWQPEPGLREATVIVPYGGRHPGFVLVAQSLGGVSNQQLELSRNVLYVWLGVLLAAFVMLRVLRLPVQPTPH
jgi:hypothetical protein